MKTVALIPSAGQGTRMKADQAKQYLQIMGKPIIYWTLKVFEETEIIDEVILIVPKSDISFCRNDVVAQYGFAKVAQVVAGGRRRQDSVYNGLKAIKGFCDVVCVHDGARPLIDPVTITKAVNTAAHFGAACVAVKVKDTIKQITDDGFIQYTPNRRYLYAAQTPQAFEYNLLQDAMVNAEKENIDATDDSSLVERLGGRVVIVEGSYTNLKITTPSDLLLAAELIKDRLVSN